MQVLTKHSELGYPTKLTDLDAMIPKVPAEDNAALLYEEAVNLMGQNTSVNQPDDFFSGGNKHFNTDHEAASQLMEDHARLFELMRGARMKHRVSWSLKPSQKVMLPNVAGYSEHRAIAKRLYFAMAYSQHRGDREEAIRFCHDLVAHSEAMMQYPDYISQLVAWAIHALALDIVENPEVSPVFQADEPDSIKEAKLLINRLLNEDRVRNGYEQGQIAGAVVGLVAIAQLITEMDAVAWRAID
jgi:hypothetical protein